MVVATNECTSIAGHFNGYAEELEQYMRHCLMQHIQGYSGSHWTPPSGDYSLHIASAAARATAKKSSMTNVPTLMAILMAIEMQRYYTAQIA